MGKKLELEGINGWLLFFIVLSFLEIIIFVIYFPLLTLTGFKETSPNFSDFGIYILIALVFIVFLILALRKNHHAKKFAIIGLLLSLYNQFMLSSINIIKIALSNPIIQKTITNPDNIVIPLSTINGFSISYLINAIIILIVQLLFVGSWIFYFIKSQRVKNTFVK